MENEIYLKKFRSLKDLTRCELIKELDYFWDYYNLDNNKRLDQQIENVAKFYSHPVWVLNGLFSANDEASRKHRIAISKYISNLNVSKIADFGGGSGVLSKFITQNNENVKVDIIEPYPLSIFTQQFDNSQTVRFISTFDGLYDVIIAQDVLEHVDSPIKLAQTLINSAHVGGYIFFANCFLPEIKCHLPANFYLRSTFNFLMKFAGLNHIGSVVDAEHVQVFKKVKKSNYLVCNSINFILFHLKFIFDIYDSIKKVIKKNFL